LSDDGIGAKDAPGATGTAARTTATSAPRSLRHSAGRVLPLAWPVVVGQVSVLAFATVDTVLVARFAAADLAALAVGAAAYITVFIGLMGVILAISPIVGQLHGAGRDDEAGAQVHQALWVAFALAALGGALLLFPAPFLALARAGPEVADKVRGYLTALAFSLPASLMFTVYRGFNTAVSRPKAVMVLQLSALGLKIPLSTALVFGVPAIGLPALGVVGCGIATAVVMWAQALAGFAVMRRDPFYRRFAIFGRGLDRPQPASLRALLKLGLPMGATLLVEVSGFSFMALFIARLGTTPVAGHQLAANLVTLMFMLPLGLASGTSTLVAQRIGAKDLHDAHRLGWHGLQIGLLVATLLGSVVFVLCEPILRLYTTDQAVIMAALPLVAWLVLFHVADAAQTIAAFVLRAHKIATLPLVVHVLALWGVGLGGGYVLAFHAPGWVPPALRGAPGFWLAATMGLVLAALLMTGLLARVLRQQRAAMRQS
jgi:multidrug resistance protein, MATE family